MNQAVDRNLARQWFQAVHEGNLGRIDQIARQNPGIVNIYSRAGTALTIACEQINNNGPRGVYYDVIQTLLELGANPNLQNDNDMLPIMILLEGFDDAERREISYYQDMFQLLIEHGMNVNAFTEQRETALMFACKSNYMRSVRYLVEDLGADVNAERQPYATALLYATNTGSVEMVEYLIQHGAMPNRILITLAQSGEFDNKPAIKELLLRAAAAAPAAPPVPAAAAAAAAAAPAAPPIPAAASAPLAEEEEKLDPEERARRNQEKVRKNQWFAAVMEGKKRNIQTMIKNGINVNMTNDKGNTALIYAIVRNNFELASLLLKNGRDPNIAIPESGKTPLMIALLQASKANASKGIASLTMLIDNLIQKSNLDTQDVNGDTALHYAVQLKQDKLLLSLLNKGANPNVKNKFGNTPLMMICTHKNSTPAEDKILDHLLDDPRTDKDTQSNDGASPLMYAIMSNNIKFVNKLIQKKVNVNIVDNKGNSALIISVFEDPKILQALLRVNGIDINHRDELGRTALAVSIQVDKENNALLLLEHRADPNIIPTNGISPLMYSLNKDPKVLTALLKVQGIEINHRDPDGETALTRAIKNKKTNAALLLLEHGADPNILPNDGKIPIVDLFNDPRYPNKKRLILSLLDHGVDPNTHDPESHQNTLLCMAVLSQDMDIFNRLIELGADVNRGNGQNLTPLMFASHNGNQAMIAALLERGADVNQRAQSNLSALLYAIANGKNPDRVGTVSLLLQAQPPIRLNDQFQRSYTALIAAAAHNLTEVMLLLLTAGANPNYRDDQGVSALELAIRRNNMEQINILLDHGAKPTANIQTMVDDNRIQNPEILELLRTRFRIVPRPLLWTGMSRSDVSTFDDAFLDDIKTRNDNVVCPVCLRSVNRIDGCMYMSHNCKEEGGVYHEELYEKYKTPEGNIMFCTICGRICGKDPNIPGDQHRHYQLASPNDPLPPLYPIPDYRIDLGPDPFQDNCRETNFGGGVIEKAARYMAIRQAGLALNPQAGQMRRKDALIPLVEAAWNTAKAISDVPSVAEVNAIFDAERAKRRPQGIRRQDIPPVPPANPELRQRIIDQLNRKAYNLPSANFPLATELPSPNVENANRINVQRREPNFSNPELLPVIHRYGFDAVMQSNVNNTDYNSNQERDKLIQFRHRRKNGEINLHENQFVDNEVLINRISGLLPTFYANADAGRCVIPGCDALIYPEEIAELVRLGLFPQEVYEQYRIKFNNKFYRLAGGNRNNQPANKNSNLEKAMKNIESVRMSNNNGKNVIPPTPVSDLPFFQKISNPQCLVPGRINGKVFRGGKYKKRVTRRKGMIMYPKKGKRVHKIHTHKKGQKHTHKKGRKQHPLRRKTRRS
jgi:ankyrin repeat protein